MKEIKIGRFVQWVIRGQEVELLDAQLLEKIAKCYLAVFNESWGEKWTDETALAEIKRSFRNEAGREFIGTILFLKEEVVGFSWGVLADFSAIALERDFPFDAPTKEKEESLKTLIRWSDVFDGGDKILIFREIGALKAARGRLAGFLAYHLFQTAIDGGGKNLFLWTSPKSAAFKLGIGLMWRPIFFFDSGLLLMGGMLRYSFNLAEKVLSYNPWRIWKGYKEIKRNRSV